MNGNKWVRQMHRWLSMAFTAGVIANVIAIMSLDATRQEQPAFWVYLLALVPLGLLLLSGLYLFALPYLSAGRRGRRIGREEVRP